MIFFSPKLSVLFLVGFPRRLKLGVFFFGILNPEKVFKGIFFSAFFFVCVFFPAFFLNMHIR